MTPETPLKNKIIDWLKGYDYWFQYSGSRLLEGENVSDALADKTYQLFKEDYALKGSEDEREEIIFNEIAGDTAAVAGNLQLQFIKEIENVNALATGQSIPINPNLTIIYGGNGTGKSGYVRLLNNAFSSRGDKQILPNVFSDAAIGEPACKFTFQSTSTPYDLAYPSQKSNIEFSQYSVFDTYSIRVHLEQDNKLNFTPIGFEFFEKILQLYEAVKSKLYAEIKANRPLNEFEKFFVNDNDIKNVIANLGANSNVEELKSLGTYTKGDAAKLTELIAKREELKTLDIPKKIAELQKIHLQLVEFTSRLQAILDYLKPEDIEHYKSLITSIHKFQELAKQEGVKSLENYNIEGLGSNEWKDFLRASKSYVSAIYANRDGKIYPSENDSCLFCLQPLTEKENSLINSYWNLLKSEAENELNRIIQAIRELEQKLKRLLPVKFDETTTLFEYVDICDSALAVKWKDIVTLSETARQNVISDLVNRNLDLPMPHFAVSTNEFDKVITQLKATIDDLFQKNPSKEIEELEKQIQFLTDKNLLNKLLEQVLVFVAAHKWAAKAESSASAFNPRSVTIKQGELFSTHITDKYTETFIKECGKLNAPSVVEISQKNKRGTTLRKLQVAGVVANSILSEGEQRAISLADFLTEVQMNPTNKGVFFDDPVTSQDHHRREKIAERLVELALQKQVIVFTHDIAFFIRLKIVAETTTTPYSYTTIRNIGGNPGIISPDLPWTAQPVKQRIGTLRDRLVRLKKIEQSGNEDEYLFAAKSWYGLLREGWERAVEERLFKGVVERFSLGVQTQKLKKVVITNELLEDIEIGMTESSSWIHDAAAGLNPTPPDTIKAEADLNKLNDFSNKCVPA
ncbi:MAG: AAA family ATPase [Bacteroidales bacterium]|nr:AAA family ATPase [Bacteroidales bacterium]MDD4439940.1 AAA family ATPase [Tissierellia bacterium]